MGHRLLKRTSFLQLRLKHNHSTIMKPLKTLAIFAAVIGSLAILPEDMPTPAPYAPTGNPAQRVREFIQGDRSTLDDADLHSLSVPEPLRKAAQQLID